MAITVRIVKTAPINNEGASYVFLVNNKPVVNPSNGKPLLLKVHTDQSPNLSLELPFHGKIIKICATDYISQIQDYIKATQICNRLESKEKKDTFARVFHLTTLTTNENASVSAIKRATFLTHIFKLVLDADAQSQLTNKRSRDGEAHDAPSSKKIKIENQLTDVEITQRVIAANIKKVERIRSISKRQPYSLAQRLMIDKMIDKAASSIKSQI